MSEEEQMKKNVIEAAASIMIDKLPLSEDYVVEYLRRKLEDKKKKEEKGPVLVYKKR